MVAVHERFRQQHVRLPASRGHPLRLAGRQRNRLLAQHMLARLRRPDRPFHMKMIRKRNIDGVDARIGEQLLVAAVRLRNVELPGRLLRSEQLAASDCRHFPRLGSPDARDDGAHRNAGAPEYAPAQFVGHHCHSSIHMSSL